MELMELYRKIELLPEDIDFLKESAKRLPLKELDGFIEGMTCMETAEQSYLGLKDWLDAYEQSPAPVTTAIYNRDLGFGAVTESLRTYDMLYCYLESARRAYEKYCSKGISEHIFIDTMKCFPRFMDECQARNGSRYFERDFWTYRQTCMRLFRIGALEYEMVKEPADGSLSIHLHIPSDADLSEPSVDASLQEAEEFFRRYYPVYDGAEYVCGSWLLSPALGRLLPEGSHILAFQKRFVIDRVNENERSYMRWLFQSPDDTPVSALPERTRLQRTAKAYLLDGGKIGVGRGRLRG